MYCENCGFDLTNEIEKGNVCFCPNCGRSINRDDINKPDFSDPPFPTNDSFVSDDYISPNVYNDYEPYGNENIPSYEENIKSKNGKVTELIIIAVMVVVICATAAVITTIVLKNRRVDVELPANETQSYVKKTSSEYEEDDEKTTEEETTTESQLQHTNTTDYPTDIVAGRIYYVSDATPSHAGLNLKSRPSSDSSSKIKTLSEGTQVIIERTYSPSDNGYVYISYYDTDLEDHRKGWVMAQHLVATKPSVNTEEAPDNYYNGDNYYDETEKYKTDYFFYGYIKGSNKTTYDFPYIYPSDERLITREELDKCSKDTVQLIMNEMYAKHGWKFSNTDNGRSKRAFFETKYWYDPIYDEQDEARFNGTWNYYEEENWQTIIDYQKDKGWRK